MPPRARDVGEESQSYKMSAVVNRAVYEKFKIAIMWRYGSTYDLMGQEVTRALSDRTAVLMAEVNTANPMVIPAPPTTDDDDWHENVFDGRERREEKS